MKPIDDPRFAAAVRLFEKEHAFRRTAGADQAHADILQQSGFAAKPSRNTHYYTMGKLREAVFARLDAKRSDKPA